MTDVVVRRGWDGVVTVDEGSIAGPGVREKDRGWRWESSCSRGRVSGGKTWQKRQRGGQGSRGGLR